MRIDDFEELSSTFHAFASSAVVSAILSAIFFGTAMLDGDGWLLFWGVIFVVLALASARGAVKTWEALHGRE